MLVALVASASAGCAGTTRNGEPAAATASASTPEVPTPVSPSAPVVPAAALLQPADLAGATSPDPRPDDEAFLRPPRPCGAAGPSDALRLAAARKYYFVEDPALTGGRLPSHTLFELVMLFRADGGAAYLTELRDELARCARGTNDRAWTVTGTGDRLTLTVEQTVEYADAKVRQTIPVLVTRTGNAVVVLADLGYEETGGDQALLANVVDKAVERARANT